MMLKPPIKRCPSCEEVHTSAMVCPHCGHHYEPTHRQLAALEILRYRHECYPERANIASVFLGLNTVQLLRRLIPLGLVEATKGGKGSRQFFTITDAGRAKLKEVGR